MRRALALCLVAAACGAEDAEQKAALAKARAQKAAEAEATERQRHETKARTEAFVRARQAVAASVKHVVAGEPPTAKRACPDEQFATLGFDDRKIWLIDAAHLAELAGSPAKTPRPFTADDLVFLTDGLTDEVHASGGMTRELEAMAAAKYVGVLRQGEVTLPSIQDGKLAGGTGKGWLVIHEKASGQPICAAPYEAKSSERVSVTRLPNKRDLSAADQLKIEEQTAVIADFKRQHRVAFVQALKSVSQRLVLAHQE